MHLRHEREKDEMQATIKEQADLLKTAKMSKRVYMVVAILAGLLCLILVRLRRSKRSRQK